MNKRDIANYQDESKIYSDASMEDSFSDDKVIVVLTNAESLRFKSYTASDFSEIGCSQIIELTPTSTNKVDQDVDDRSTYNRIICLELSTPGKQEVLMAIKALEDRDDIRYVGPNYLISACATTSISSNDEGQYALDVTKLPEAQSCVSNGATVRVGIIDTGVDATHPALANKVNTGLSRNFTDLNNVTQLESTTDYVGHGTHIAGIIAAGSNAYMECGGVCATVEIVSLKATNTADGIYQANAIEAIKYANQQNIPILNFSYGFSENSEALLEAIEEYDGLFVCSAGNAGLNLESTSNNVYPAEYSLDNVITVGASNLVNGLETIWVLSNTYSSNYGKTTVDIFAPGASIMSCFPSHLCEAGICSSYLVTTHKANGYHIMSGTSMAAPYVAGVAALILSQDPYLTTVQLRNRILTCSDSLSTFSNWCVDGRRLNAYKTVHPHTYTFEAYSSGMHECTCTSCGHVTLETHTWVVISTTLPQYRCTVCNYITNRITGLSLPENLGEE